MPQSHQYSRCSGILAHITSLPSAYGIGDLGSQAYDFIDFLVRARQKIWQILPLGPTDPAFSHSPYMSVSAFAGNPLLISPEKLYHEGLVQKSDIESDWEFSPYAVDFDKVATFKFNLLQKAFDSFSSTGNSEYRDFLDNETWLPDYSLFMTLKRRFAGKAWYQWPAKALHLDREYLDSLTTSCRDHFEYYCFEQYIFHKQWQELHAYSKSKGIELFGDIPIYVSLDSADVWANQSIFQLDHTTRLPTHVAGVPPDYFSETGQKWGNPLYHWNHKDINISQKLQNWWVQRFQNVFKYVDLARIDHFRGFESYWSIPADEDTAMKGRWHKGPGASFFNSIFKNTGKLKIVAEDLGEITDEVITLRDKLGFPGMKVLQFAFDGNTENSFLPHNYESSSFFVYSGTHDNDTTVGWFLDDRISDNTRSYIRSIANKNLHDNSSIHEDLIFLAMSSIASVCIFPLQDILGFGSDCRMNTPGVSTGNWRWRCSEEFLTEGKSKWLASMTTRFGRSKQGENVSS